MKTQILTVKLNIRVFGRFGDVPIVKLLLDFIFDPVYLRTDTEYRAHDL